jgi:cytolysin (calcineurin-like family phosphatase)
MIEDRILRESAQLALTQKLILQRNYNRQISNIKAHVILPKKRICRQTIPEMINIMTGRELQLQYNHSSSPGNISIVRIAPNTKIWFQKVKKNLWQVHKIDLEFIQNHTR